MAEPISVPETAYEEEHVHQVYNQIASHFSSTRFKPWPVVHDFLRSLPLGSIGLDVGCGNGKYLTVRNDVFIVASDRSSELIKFATQHQPHSSIIADTLGLPHPSSTFDFAICIAVIHHLSTPERRQAGVRAILSTLRPKSSTSTTAMSNKRKRSRANGQALIFVWALEQKSSRRGWDTGHEQDVLVPWVLKPNNPRSDQPASGKGSNIIVQKSDNVADTDTSMKPSSSNDLPQTYQRYYHLYREGELETDIVAAGGVVVKKGYDRDNWWAVCERND